MKAMSNSPIWVSCIFGPAKVILPYLKMYAPIVSFQCVSFSWIFVFIEPAPTYKYSTITIIRVKPDNAENTILLISSLFHLSHYEDMELLGFSFTKLIVTR